MNKPSRKLRLPRVRRRRPYCSTLPGYEESDRDFMENNREACVWFLENRNKLARALAGRP